MVTCLGPGARNCAGRQDSNEEKKDAFTVNIVVFDGIFFCGFDRADTAITSSSPAGLAASAAI